MNTYAYARVSSYDQNLARQLQRLQDFGINAKHIFFDKKSGKDFERINYRRMIKCLRQGDLLVITSIVGSEGITMRSSKNGQKSQNRSKPTSSSWTCLFGIHDQRKIPCLGNLFPISYCRSSLLSQKMNGSISAQDRPKASSWPKHAAFISGGPNVFFQTKNAPPSNHI